MFYATLVPTLIVFVIGLIAGWRPLGPARETVCGIVIAGVVGILIFAGFLPTVTLVFVALLCGAMGLRTIRPKLFPRFAPPAVVALVSAYALAGGFAILRVREMAELRSTYPIESMSGRFREPERAPPLSSTKSERLESLESEIDLIDRWKSFRHVILARLHDEQTLDFVNSPSFGVGRLLREPSAERLRLPPREPGDSPAHGPGSSGMHESAVLDFANPAGFGYVRDRDHVAGFQSHGFTNLPAPTIDRVELVSLLMHDEPAVYVSDHLPEMARLQGVPTRPLDEFEVSGLANLRQGENLYESSAHPTRLMGSLRNAKQCVECHGGCRGDLLGAFSYTFR